MEFVPGLQVRSKYPNKSTFSRRIRMRCSETGLALVYVLRNNFAFSDMSRTEGVSTGS
jgi:hypothetical protein